LGFSTHHSISPKRALSTREGAARRRGDLNMNRIYPTLKVFPEPECSRRNFKPHKSTMWHICGSVNLLWYKGGTSADANNAS